MKRIAKLGIVQMIGTNLNQIWYLKRIFFNSFVFPEILPRDFIR